MIQIKNLIFTANIVLVDPKVYFISNFDMANPTGHLTMDMKLARMPYFDAWNTELPAKIFWLSYDIFL